MKGKFTPGPWTAGWGNGLTGPNTPSVAGVTCSQAVANHQWHDAIKNKPSSEWPECPKEDDYLVPVSIGEDTVAIVVGPNRKANARLIAAAPIGDELAELVLGLEILCISSRSNAPCFDAEDFEARDNSGTVAEVRQLQLDAIVAKAREFKAKAEGK